MRWSRTHTRACMSAHFKDAMREPRFTKSHALKNSLPICSSAQANKPTAMSHQITRLEKQPPNLCQCSSQQTHSKMSHHYKCTYTPYKCTYTPLQMQQMHIHTITNAHTHLKPNLEYKYTKFEHTSTSKHVCALKHVRSYLVTMRDGALVLLVGALVLLGDLVK